MASESLEAPAAPRNRIGRRVVLAAGLAAGCGVFNGSHTLRYRLKISAFVGGKVYEGASVLQIRWTNVGGLANFNGGQRFARSAWGQAIVVDIEERGKMFGLLHPPYAMGVDGFSAGNPERVLIPNLPASERDTDALVSGEVFEHLKKLTGEFDVQVHNRPVLARFRDIADPKSAELINRDDLAATYGPGARLLGVTVAVTRDGITRGIEREFPWWDETWDGALWPPEGGPSLGPTLSHRITKKDFRLDGE